LIIDGASTDGTENYVLELISSGLAEGVSEPDKGIYDAMNKGLRRALGEYVIFLNAGDSLLNSSSLDTAVRELKSGRMPDIAFFGSVMDFGNFQFVRRVKQPSYIWHGQPALHQATFFRRNFHQKYPYNTNYKIVADYEALARMAKGGAAMKSFDSIISVNTFEADAMSGRHKTLLVREAIEVQRLVLKLPIGMIFISVMRRSLSSLVFKVLTFLREKTVR
jgi:putative colanic acid biosynthesis glycosyltransferase